MKITFIESNGTNHVVDASAGTSVMQAAVSNNVPGIYADCGGACACATCHVHVTPEWVETVGPPNSVEEDLLEMVEDRSSASRLSCQITVGEALDGLVVTIPSS